MTMPDRTARTARLVSLLVRIGLLAMLPISAFAANVSNGQRLYAVHCAGCHGMDGVSVMPQAQNLARFELFTQPDQNLVDVIRTGRNLMPPYLGILKETDIIDVVSYLRTFR